MYVSMLHFTCLLHNHMNPFMSGLKALCQALGEPEKVHSADSPVGAE